MKLYSWAAFLILRAQGLQTRSDKFSFLVNRNPIEPQQWAKISPALSTLPDGENKFSNEARPPLEVKLTPQNLQLLFFLRLHWVFVPFYKFLWESRCRHSVAKIFSSFTATKPLLAIHSRVRSFTQKSVRLILIGRWSDSWDNWNEGRRAKDAAFVAGIPFSSFLHSPPLPATTLTSAMQAMLSTDRAALEIFFRQSEALTRSG